MSCMRVLLAINPRVGGLLSKNNDIEICSNSEYLMISSFIDSD